MELTPELGKKIIAEAKELIDEHIIIVNKQAVIIASTDTARIGNFHEGAKQTIYENTVIVLTKEDEQRLKGIKAGINLPIAINQEVIGVIGITGNPTKVTPFGSIMQKMTELLIQESFYLQELEWQARSLEAFLFDWIQLDTFSSVFRQRADVLGIDISTNRKCLLINVHDANGISMANVIPPLKNWLELTIDGIVAKWGNDRLLILCRERTLKSNEQLETMMASFQTYARESCKTDVSIGIGEAVEPACLKRSYAQAEKALKAATTSKRVVLYENLLLEICLHDVQPTTKEAFVERALGAIMRDSVLLITLQTFINLNANLKESASKLHIHINTLHYRLQKIHQQTGLDPRKISATTAFYVAFYFMDENTNK